MQPKSFLSAWTVSSPDMGGWRSVSTGLSPHAVASQGFPV